MGQTDLLRKLIREEVRAVFQEELAGILKEAIIANRQPIVETKTTAKPAATSSTTNAKKVAANKVKVESNKVTQARKEQLAAIAQKNMAIKAKIYNRNYKQF